MINATQTLLAEECLALWNEFENLITDPLEIMAWISYSSNNPLYNHYLHTIDWKDNSEIEKLRHARRVLQFEIDAVKHWRRTRPEDWWR